MQQVITCQAPFQSCNAYTPIYALMVASYILLCYYSIALKNYKL